MEKNENYSVLFEHNKLFFIKDKFKTLHIKNITDISKQYLSSFLQTESGYATFKFDGSFRYSRYNPVKSLLTLPRDKNNYLFFEFGISLQLLFILKNLNSFIPMKKLIIVYPSDTIFILSWFIIDWKLLFEQHKSSIYIFLVSSKNALDNNKQMVNANKNIVFHNIADINEFSNILSTIVDENDTESLAVHSDNALLLQPFCDEKSIKQIIMTASKVIDLKKKSYSTGSFFSFRWEKNAIKNNYITRKTNAIKPLPDLDKNIIIWGAGYDVPEYLESLEEAQKISISKDFITISIPSTVQILVKNGIKPDFQLTFDGSFYNTFQYENTDIPLISSPTSYFALIKRAAQNHTVYIVSVAIEEENYFFANQKKVVKTKILPFYGSSLLTLVCNASALSRKKLDLYLIGTDFKIDAPLTHHKYYPLYNYMRKRESYASTIETWETKQKIQNTHKFLVYKESLTKLKYKNKNDLSDFFVKK